MANNDGPQRRHALLGQAGVVLEMEMRVTGGEIQVIVAIVLSVIMLKVTKFRWKVCTRIYATIFAVQEFK
jgi:hypothetical protein